ncbi:proteasome lid subunit RPN8/RPN11 [Catenulispora sp. GP43]|uniref:JAB N-terminal domain-containing protein n=1 Tax=Catenulispora sp. GP43 TaxID=3156263 RepID=UPI0035158275
MSVDIDLYRTDDYVPAGQLPLGPMLSAALSPVVGEDLADYSVLVSFLPVAEEQELSGSPTLVNLRAQCGYVLIQINRGDEVVYRHPHTVREIVGEPLQRVLAEHFPGESHWGFGLSGPGLEQFALVRPAPRIHNEVSLGSTPTRRPRLNVEEVPEEEPAISTLAELGVGGDPARSDAPVEIVVRADVFDTLAKNGLFSGEIEEGGFLVGNVYRDGENSGRHLIEVTAAAPAERTGASLLRFTFTGESFLRIGEQITRRHRGERLIGWYHTHLFPATENFGLSSIDVSLHHGTFRQPWQTAALVNLSDEGRTLRFYRAAGDEMLLTSYWVAGDDSR